MNSGSIDNGYEPPHAHTCVRAMHAGQLSYVESTGVCTFLVGVVNREPVLEEGGREAPGSLSSRNLRQQRQTTRSTSAQPHGGDQYLA